MEVITAAEARKAADTFNSLERILDSIYSEIISISKNGGYSLDRRGLTSEVTAALIEHEFSVDFDEPTGVYKISW